MRIFNDIYNLNSNKITRNYVFCVLSDIHITSAVTYKLLDRILKEISHEKPDYVFIAGDLVQNADDLIIDDVKNKFKYFFSNLQDISKVYISLGNHDLKDGKKTSHKNTLKYLKSLETNRLFVLDNKTIELDDISITGFATSFESYYEKKNLSWVDHYVEELEKCSFKFDKNKYNVFLTHSPVTVSKKETIEKTKKIMKNVDLILCGHMHDGYIPKVFQKLFNIKSDKGFRVNEGKNLKDTSIGIVDKCRGQHKVLNASMIISRGVRKATDNNIIFNLADKICSKDIVTIKLNK